MRRRKIIVMVAIALALICCVALAACNSEGVQADRQITITILNGEHYQVVGDNKRVVEKGESAVFTVSLDRGYKIVGAYGDKCEISEEYSFQQTVTFVSVYYKSTVRLETAEMGTSAFVAENDLQGGKVLISSLFGQAEEDLYYVGDVLTLTASANKDYRFWCWSKGGYINDGGEFVDDGMTLQIENFESIGKLYANFRKLSEIGNLIIYKLGLEEIEQDVTKLVASHTRANTYTAVDLRERGVDCESKYLSGYVTEDGEYVGLGSRVSVSDKMPTVLTAVWKDYTDAKLFQIDQGKLSAKSDLSGLDEIVAPREINGEIVTAIARNAFENCKASTFYIPDSVTTIEEDAFKNCENLTDFYMSDNIMNISDASFPGCKHFTTLHLNAYLKPRSMTSHASVKADAFDRLAVSSKKDDITRFVMLGGSSVDYGYSLATVEELWYEQFPNKKVEVFNFGFNANYAEFAQFEILNAYLKEGDVFLHAPEQYNGAWYGDRMLSPLTSEESAMLINGGYIFILASSNWGFISHLTVNKYGNLFSIFAKFNRDRSNSAEQDYSQHFDFEATPSVSPMGDKALEECGVDKYFSTADINFDACERAKYAKQDMYEVAIAKGVHTFVTFPPMNRHRLLYKYGSEENYKKVLDEYTVKVKEILNNPSIKVLLTQNDTIYDGRYFSNNDYHLGSPFRIEHTKNVVSVLIDKLKGEASL